MSMKSNFRNSECKEFVCSKSQTCIMIASSNGFCKKNCYSHKCDLCFMRKTCKNKGE